MRTLSLALLVGLFSTAPAFAQDAAERVENPKAKSFSFTFRHAPWGEVLELFAESAGLVLDPGDVPEGTFSYVDRNAYTANEALDVLNGYLMPRGYTLVRRDEFLVCFDLTKPMPPNLVPNVEVDELKDWPRNSLVNVVIPIGSADPTRTATELASVVGDYGRANPLSSADAVVVVTTAANAERIARWLTSVEDFDPEMMRFQSFGLKHVEANDAAELVAAQLGVKTTPKNVSYAAGNTSYRQGTEPPGTVFVQPGGGRGFGQPGGGFGQPGGRPGFAPGGADFEQRRREEEARRRERERQEREERIKRDSERKEEQRRAEARDNRSVPSSKIRITAETRTNRLFVTARTVDLIRTEQILAAIDVEPHPDYVPVKRGKPYLRAYKVHNIKAVEVAKTLSKIDPDMVVNEDGWQEYVHVWGDDLVHRDARAFIAELDGHTEASKRQLTVYPLSNTDPLAAATTIRGMFYTDGEDAPTVEADPYTGALMIRATRTQTELIKKLLADLGEDGTPTRGRPTGSGTIRAIPLGNVDPDVLLPLLEEMWNTGDEDALRIIPNRPTVRRHLPRSQRSAPTSSR